MTILSFPSATLLPAFESYLKFVRFLPGSPTLQLQNRPHNVSLDCSPLERLLPDLELLLLIVRLSTSRPRNQTSDEFKARVSGGPEQFTLLLLSLKLKLK